MATTHTSHPAGIGITAEARAVLREVNDCALCGKTDWLHLIVHGWGECGYTKLHADGRGVFEVIEGQNVAGLCNRCYHEGCWSDDHVYYTDDEELKCNLGDALRQRLESGCASGVWIET